MQGKKKKLTAADISGPDISSFKHIQHVGYNAEQGVTMDKLDPALRELFEKAGVKQEDLEDASTRQFISEFMETQQQEEVATIKQVAPGKSQLCRSGACFQKPSRYLRLPNEMQNNLVCSIVRIIDYVSIVPSCYFCVGVLFPCSSSSPNTETTTLCI